MSSRIPYGVWAFFPLTLVAVLVEAGLVALVVDHWGETLVVRLLALPIGLLVALIWWTVRAMRGTPDEARGEVIEHDQHPLLWRQVVEVADAVGVRPPDRLVITLGADVSARDLGAGVDLCIGLPLLASLSVTEFRATTAHALAHGASPSRHRLVQAVEWVRIYKELSFGPVKWALGLYVAVYEAMTAGPIAALEHDADEQSVRVAGAASAIAAMHRLVVVDTAWRRVLDEFAPLFEPASRRAPLTEALYGVLSADPPTQPYGQTDESLLLLMSSPHLPLTDRIAVVEGEHELVLSASPDPAITTSLLDGGPEAFEPLEKELLAQDWPLATWDEVAAEAGSHNIRGIAHAIGSDLERRDIADTSLGGVVTILEHQEDAGAPRFATLLTCDTDEEAVGALSIVLTAAVIDAGQARFVSDWTEVVRLEDLAGEPLDIDELARAAITEPFDCQGLREWLLSRHVNLDGPVGRQDQEHPDWMASVSHVTGPWKGRYDVHVWSTGLLAVPIHHRVVKEDKAAYTTSHQRDRLMETVLEGTGAGRALQDAFWIDRADVVGGGFRGGLVRLRIQIKLVDGTVHELRSAVESEMVESAEAVGSAFGYLLSIPIHD